MYPIVTFDIQSGVILTPLLHAECGKLEVSIGTVLLPVQKAFIFLILTIKTLSVIACFSSCISHFYFFPTISKQHQTISKEVSFHHHILHRLQIDHRHHHKQKAVKN